MGTHNYDLLLQVDEKLLNKALAAFYYSGFLKLDGDYSFVENIPEELQQFTRFSYKIRMKNEPFLDLRGEENAYIKFALELKLIVLGGIVLEFDAYAFVNTTVSYDAVNRKVAFDLTEANVTDLYINDTYKFHKRFLDNINIVIAEIITAYLTEDVKKIEIPLVLYRLDLPMMPDDIDSKLPVKMGDFLISGNRLFTMGINFFNDIKQDIYTVEDMTGGSELYISIRKEVLYGIFNFWWEKTTYDKCEEFSGTIPVNAEGFLENSADIVTRLISLGFVQTKTDYENLVLAYEGSVKVLEKPEFEFCEGNKVIIHSLKVNLKVQAALEADVTKETKLDTSSFIPDNLTPWEDDKLLKKSQGKKEILKLNEDVELLINGAEGIIRLSDSNNLIIDVVKANFHLELGDAWYNNLTEKAVNWLLELLEKKVLEKLPDLTVSPSLFLSKIDVNGYTLEVNIDGMSFDNDEVSIRMRLGANELISRPVPAPIYMGNKNTMKIHSYDCKCVEDIEMSNRVGFYVLYEALKAGYSVCNSCLGSGTCKVV